MNYELRIKGKEKVRDGRSNRKTSVTDNDRQDRPKLKREFSAGGIVFNNKGQVLVTQHSQNKHWSFPKGLLDHPEQTTEESALREVKEEGGIEAEILGKVGYSKYVYTFNGEKVFKVVTYFLMKYISGDPKDHDWEVSEAGWYEVDDALKQLTFSQDKVLLKKAVDLFKVKS